MGSEALERVTQALGARAALPECRRLVKEGLGGWNWQQQHAALTALGNLADGESVLFLSLPVTGGVHFGATLLRVAAETTR